MTKSWMRRLPVLWASVVCAIWGAAAAADRIPWPLKESLEQPLQERVRELLKKQERPGSQQRPGFLPGSLRRTGREDTYHVVSLHTHSPGRRVAPGPLPHHPDVDARGQRTGPSPTRRWRRKSPGTSSGRSPETRRFTRSIPSISTARESGSTPAPAVMYVDYRRGKPSRMVLRATANSPTTTPLRRTLPTPSCTGSSSKRHGDHVEFSPSDVLPGLQRQRTARNCSRPRSPDLTEASVDDLRPDLATKYRRVPARSSEQSP